MSGHTPGPWYPILGMVEIDRDDEPDVCSCYPRDFGQEHDRIKRRPGKEVYANAKLIAAAPALYEAAKMFVDSYTPRNGAYALGELSRAREAAESIINELDGE